MAEKKKKEGKLDEALLKVALGYQVAEVTEEYAEVDGELKLTKRKRTKKDVPPDLKAVQLLLTKDGGGEAYAEWSDEALETERRRLLAELQKATEGAERAAKAASPPKSTVKTTAKTAVKTASGAESEKPKTTRKRAKPRKRVVRKTKGTGGKA